MPIVLCRVDERLIHGQVVVGWGSRLNIDRVIVIDDDIAGSSWEQELYCLGVPAEVEARFASVAEARRDLADWERDSHRTVLLLRDVTTLQRFAEDELLKGVHVNLGGIHHAEGRQRVLPYLFLSPDERGRLTQVASQGVVLTAQDLPGSRIVPLDELLTES